MAIFKIFVHAVMESIDYSFASLLDKCLFIGLKSLVANKFIPTVRLLHDYLAKTLTFFHSKPTLLGT